jgi:hypothetical protein
VRSGWNGAWFIGTPLLLSMILSILNRYPHYAAYGIFRQLYGAICSAGTARRHCATVPAVGRRSRGAEIPPRPRRYSTSPAPGFVRPDPKMPEFYPFQCSAIGSVQILGGLIIYLLLAICCRQQHNDRSASPECVSCATKLQMRQMIFISPCLTPPPFYPVIQWQILLLHIL